MVEALLRLMATPRDVRGPVNLGNPEEVSVRALADAVLRLTASSGGIVYLPPRREDPRRRCPDIREMTRLTGWQPVTPLVEGLRRTDAWMREEVGARRRPKIKPRRDAGGRRPEP